MKYRRFLLLDFLAALLSVPLWIAIGFALGHYLGDEISRILLSLKHLKTGITTVIVVVVLIVIARMVLKFKKAKKPVKTIPPNNIRTS